MNLKVIKRDGRIKEFDMDRIRNAIEKAGANDKIVERVSNYLNTYFVESPKIYSVYDIEKVVIDTLLKFNYNDIALAYEGFRAVQSYKRSSNTTDKSILELVRGCNEEITKENSNKNATITSTQRDLIAGEVSKDISMRKLIPQDIVEAHNNAVIHWHDSDYTLQKMMNCCLINIQDMLDNGTVINEKLVETPKSFETACTVVTQIMAQIASGQFGGQSITIKHLAKYLRVTYDKYLNKYSKLYDQSIAENLANDRMMEQLKNGIQTIRYQLSTLNTGNGQSPFCTIYLEIEEGHPYEKEMALICEEMIKQRIDGMKNYKGQEIGEAFPKLVYLLEEHNCLEGGKYDYITKLSAKCNAKRLVPDYQSAKIMRQNYEGNNFPPMGCRSHLSPWKDEKGNYKWYGRFNQGVITLNLPQIGIISKGNFDLFWKLLDERLELCKKALMVRHELLLGTLSDTSPIHWQYGGMARLEKGEKIDKLLKNGYSTISLGYIGVYEMVQAMMKCSNITKEGERFSLEVMSYMRNRCNLWKKETGLGFGLYGAPAENTIYRFCRLDKKNFGVIENVTDKLYYTNSYHVNVTEEIDAFSKLTYESKFHGISSGGCISYIETPNMSKNIEAIETMINFIYHNVQYAEINSRPDVCYKCEFKGEMSNDEYFKWFCPNCGNNDESEMQVMRRTCGYIGTNLWSKGRTQEIKERVVHI